MPNNNGQQARQKTPVPFQRTVGSVLPFGYRAG